MVHPELRSRGISTLLVERVGLDTGASGGWAGTGATALRCWARGDHPAARRMALRFAEAGVRRTRWEWRLVVPLDRAADVEDEAGVRSVPPEVLTELRQRADEPGFDAQAVLGTALEKLHALSGRADLMHLAQSLQSLREARWVCAS